MPIRQADEMKSRVNVFGSSLLTAIAVILAGSFVASALVRYSPGFDSIPEDFDPEIGADTLKALHAQRGDAGALPVFYARYLARAIRGDFGISQSLKQPVTGLLLRRAPVTLHLILWGTAGGWLLALLFAWMAVWTRGVVLKAAAFTISGFLLSVPPAVLAVWFFCEEAPLSLALALALLPRLFGTLDALLGTYYASPVLLAARARGISPLVIAIRYVLRACAPQLFALLGTALVLAFGSAIPVETLCGIPGIGALALQAALARDIPLLSGLALVITVFVTLVQAAAQTFGGAAEI
jgi:peptide/nickel transport system permease protein